MRAILGMSSSLFLLCNLGGNYLHRAIRTRRVRAEPGIYAGNLPGLYLPVNVETFLLLPAA
jgi:hypothetical protein